MFKKAFAVLGLAVAATMVAIPAHAAPTDYPTCQFYQFDGSIGTAPTGNPVSVPCYYTVQYANGAVTSAYYDKNGKWHLDMKNSSK